MAKVKLVKVRQSFFDYFTPVQFKGEGAFRYNGAYLIEKDSANDKAIRAAIKASGIEAFQTAAKHDSMFKSMETNGNKMCYIDGDLSKYDFCQGFMVLGAHRRESDGPPLILDAQKQPLDVKSGKIYKGCNVNVSVDFYAQAKGNTGYRCGLIGVQFHSDNDQFSGAARPDADEFDEIAEDESSLV